MSEEGLPSELSPYVFTLSLRVAIAEGKVDFRKPIPASRQWAEQLPTDVLNAIPHILNGAQGTGDEGVISDFIHLTLQLKGLDEKKEALQFEEEEIQEWTVQLLAGLGLVALEREGKIKSEDSKSLFDPEGTWELTEEGKKEADAFKAEEQGGTVEGPVSGDHQ